MNNEEYFKYAYDYLNQLKEKNRDFVIDGDTEEIGNIPLSDLTDIDFGENLADELVVVHATDYSPALNQAIVSTESTFKQVNNIAGTHDSHRITVHTTLNCLVENNNGGNWDYRLFTVLEPFSNIDSKICGFGVSDTFFENKIQLSAKGIVLVRIEDKEKLSEEDKKMNIVYYKGDPRNAVNKAMIMMGYKPQTLEIDNIKNKDNDKRIQEYRIANNLGPSRHSRTIYNLVEDRIGMRDITITRIRNKQTNTCTDNKVDIKEVKIILENQRLSFLSDELNTIESLLEMGIAFNEKGPYFLNTQQTIERLKSYYDHEHFNFLITDENIQSFKEAMNLLNSYHHFLELDKEKDEQERQINESYDEAQKTNNLLNSLSSEVQNADLAECSYIKEFSSKLNQLLANSLLRTKISNKGIIIYSASDDELTFSNLFPEYSQDENLTSVEIDSIVIPFDKSIRLIDNLKEGFNSFQNIRQVLMENNYLKSYVEQDLSSSSFNKK